MPAHLAARKWPASWTKTSTPSTTIRDTSVSTKTSRTPHMVAGLASGPLVGLAHHRQTGGGAGPMIVEHALDDLADPSKGYLAGEEGGDGDLVGGVEHGRRHPTGPARLDARRERPEDLGPHRLECEGPGGHGVESPDAVIRQPCRVGQGVQDRQL